ncbi:MAG: 4Fe-4S binding protein, partial [Dactylosporangium sp.]|nr:4Fe-4S binding protein [Dactylosporangium sp.]NNJ61844.1 4Fe-4S binding protein [Dactylosporangium sp.]
VERVATTCRGHDVFCQEGIRQVRAALTDLAAGRGRETDLDLLVELCSLIATGTSCDTAADAARAVLALIDADPEEWRLHLRRRRCTTLTCVMSFTVYVAPEACTGCGDCVPACPRGAIAGGPGLVHVVATDRCDNCLACVPVCPAGAVRKAGPVRPRVPAAPVPIGSFPTASAPTAGVPGAGMTRRRRRRG